MAAREGGPHFINLIHDIDQLRFRSEMSTAFKR
jgi:hypothetical protein